MSEQPAPASPWQPGAAIPHLTSATGPTRWAARAADYAGRADGASPWTDSPEPGAVPPVIEPVTDRVEWLNAGRPET